MLRSGPPFSRLSPSLVSSRGRAEHGPERSGSHERATGRTGGLVIRTSTDGKDVVVAIEDSAMGTDMADLERAFNNSGGGATFAFTLPVDPQ